LTQDIGEIGHVVRGEYLIIQYWAVTVE